MDQLYNTVPRMNNTGCATRCFILRLKEMSLLHIKKNEKNAFLRPLVQDRVFLVSGQSKEGPATKKRIQKPGSLTS